MADEAAGFIEVGNHPGTAATSIVAPHEAYRVTIPLENKAAAPWEGEVSLKLLDFWESELNVVTKHLAIPAHGRVVLTESFSTTRQGIFKVAVMAGKNAPPVDVASFAVWPASAPPLADSSFFGIHVNSWDRSLVQQARRLGFRWNRNHNMLQTTWWPRVQPLPGEFKWLHDPSLELNVSNNIQVLGQFFGTPYWAAASGPLPAQSVHPGDSPYPYGARPDPEKFRNYVTQTVKRYKDRIHHWEIWNEPAVPQFWSGSPEQFAELTKVAYEAAKAEDPHAVIMAGGYTDAWRWSERAAEHGALRYCDAISFHLYYKPTDTPEALLAKITQSADFWRKLSAQHSGRGELPLWQTEGGAASTSWLRGPQDKEPLTWRQAAVSQVQADVLMQSQGLVHSFQYLTGGTNKVTELTNLDRGGSPRPMMIARAVLAHVVDRATFHELVQHDGGRTWAALYKAPGGGSITVAWTGENARVELPAEVFGTNVTGRDFMGNESFSSTSNASGTSTATATGRTIQLGDVPQYILSSIPAPDLAKALKAAPFKVLTEAKPLPKEVADGADSRVPPQGDFAAAVEKPAKLFTVDLRSFTNMGFADGPAGDGKGGWADEGEFNDFREFPTGRQTIYGVPFDVIVPDNNNGTSVISLRGLTTTPTLPVAVKGIPLPGGKVRSLFFLHSAAATRGNNIGHYVAHYADGSTVEIPIIIDQNTGDWWSPKGKKEESKPWPVRVTNRQNSTPGWRYPRVWEWPNPKPDVPVISLDFVSAGTGTTPILVGISGTQW
ncbi:hypothetical protein DB346_06775 [Verrucomicrobia bacterium LW23]|nr:hypothetical protein DB346_06775 [Verrucomicrobia bacterium LW23]